MPKLLPITRFGNPILRKSAQLLSGEDIASEQIQTLIADMRHTLVEEKYGVGLAAPQVGQSISLSIIGIRPTPHRPNLKPFETTLINPEIIDTLGAKTPLWEGCVSCGTGDDILYAQVPRYERIMLCWTDETGTLHEELVEGFTAHVVQHEVDHLNGVLFVDRVEDTGSYMMADEYRQRIMHHGN